MKDFKEFIKKEEYEQDLEDRFRTLIAIVALIIAIVALIVSLLS